MRSIIIAIVCFLIVGCAPNFLKENEKEIVYTHTVEMKKEQLKLKLLEFVNTYFKSGKAVIQTNEDGLIAGNGATFLGNDLMLVYSYDLEFTFIIKYEDNAYKMKLIVKQITMTGNRVSGDIGDYQYGKWSKEVASAFKLFDASLHKFLTEKPKLDF